MVVATRTLLAALCLVPAIAILLASPDSGLRACEVRALLIGSRSRGPEHWISKESYLIENMLEFNGIPYEFFDIYSGDLTEDVLDGFRGVIVEGWSLVWDATWTEQDLIADCMTSGQICALVGLVHGQCPYLNGTVYGALGVSVDGQGNNEHNFIVEPSAAVIYDYPGNDGFIVEEQYRGHVGMAVNSLGRWTYTTNPTPAERPPGFEMALERWMENAFGVDARVTLPVISMRVDDAQAYFGRPTRDLMDYIYANKHRIRGSGLLCTDASAHQRSDSLGQADEQTISTWGSMSLHGRDHESVGAEGANRGFDHQNNDAQVAVEFLEEHFPRYEPVQGCPNNSWNEATLHALYENGIYYHSATIRNGTDYKALYKRVLDASDDFEREKLFARGESAGLRYYPFYHVDSTGEARVYSVDWCPYISALNDPDAVLATLRKHGLDWWTPVLPVVHFDMPNAEGATLNPVGWMTVMEAAMGFVDQGSRPWRRWVDTYDYARSVQRFDQDLTVNSISISGPSVIYDVTASQPIRYMTLRAGKTGYRIKSVAVNGAEHAYFGDDYVHLPEISGQATIVVDLTSLDDWRPHVYHVDPSAVIEAAQSVCDRLQIVLSGEFRVTARIVGSNKVFNVGTTRVLPDSAEELTLDASAYDEAEHVEMSLTPSSGAVDATICVWDTSGFGAIGWLEKANSESTVVDHRIGGLRPNSPYVIMAGESPADTCVADSSGVIVFSHRPGCTTRAMWAVKDSIPAAVTQTERTDRSDEQERLFLKADPNPFTGRVIVSYQLPKRSAVVIGVYSVEGRLVRNLNEGIREAGRYFAIWDGLDALGRPVAPGVYLCSLEAASGQVHRKIVLAR